MFSLKSIPSTTSVLSTYTTFAASTMLVRSMISEVQAVTSQLIPKQLQNILLSKLGGLCSNSSSQMTLVINEYDGYNLNELYEASETYLRTKIATSMERLNVSKSPRDKNVSLTIHKGEKVIDIYEGIRVSKSPRDKNVSLTIHKGEKVIDIYEGIRIKWEMTCVETKENHQGKLENRVLELSFHNECMEKVTNS